MVKTGMRAPRLPLLWFCLIVLGACAADPGAVKAAFDAGLKAYDAGDYARAYTLWDGIRGSDLAAMRNVAIMARTGKGVKKDPARAMELLQEVAETRLPLVAVVASEADLGEMYLDGEAGKPDAEKAAEWLKEAAAARHPVAAYRLAGLYETGTGVPRDLEQARKYYQIAADVGYADATDRLAALDKAVNIKDHNISGP
jgi:uncharacterized protein